MSDDTPSPGAFAWLLVVAKWIDRQMERLGQGVSWLVLVMVLLGALNATGRFIGPYIGKNLSSNAFIEAQWYLFSLLFLLGAAYVLKRNAHVRVDVLYNRLSSRSQVWVDLLGGLLLLLPFCGFALLTSWPSVAASFSVWEVSPDPGGLPRYPIKAVILVGFGLLFVQGISQVIQKIAILRGHSMAHLGMSGKQLTDDS